MKTILNTTNRTQTDLNHEVSGFLFTVVSASALLIGLWGVLCLMSGLLSRGPVNMVRSYITAITGW